VAILRVLRTAKATLSRTFYLDEEAASAAGAVGVSVTRLDGTAVESGTATGPDAEGGYSYTFGGRDVVDELIVTWTLTLGGDAIVLDQDRIEVVGGFYFGLAEGRAIDPALTSTTKFPTITLIERRNEAEDECERICGQAFVPRFARESLTGYGQHWIALKWPMVRAIRSVSIGSYAFTLAEVAALTVRETGLTFGASWPIGRRIVIEYEHGNDRPPIDIVRGAKLRFKSLALEGRSALPDRAERVVTQTETGTIQYASPTPDRTGIPAVDAIYGRFQSPRPGFG
jgi:hypothetical protein